MFYICLFAHGSQICEPVACAVCVLLCAYVHVCMCACVHVCMCACVFACLRVIMCACVCDHVHACVCTVCELTREQLSSRLQSGNNAHPCTCAVATGVLRCGMLRSGMGFAGCHCPPGSQESSGLCPAPRSYTRMLLPLGSKCANHRCQPSFYFPVCMRDTPAHAHACSHTAPS